jgi:hypothetical protein
MKKIVLYYAIFLLFFIIYLIIIKTTHTTPNPPESDYPLLRHIQYSFTMQNTTNHFIKKAEFWAYAPVKQTSTQRCLYIDASYNYQLIQDDLGNQVLHFKFDELLPYSTRIILIRAKLSLSDTPNKIPVKDIAPFLLAEKYIESDTPEISMFAKKFKDPEPVESAKKIFNWVSHNVEYSGYLKSDRGALYALTNKKGDCTEFMYLFTALCRANNIPARGIGGYICKESKILEPSDYHNWAEFYDDGAWRIADPQKEVFMQNESHYIAMKVIGDSKENSIGKFHKFQYKGNGITVKMDR